MHVNKFFLSEDLSTLDIFLKLSEQLKVVGSRSRSSYVNIITTASRDQIRKNSLTPSIPSSIDFEPHIFFTSTIRKSVFTCWWWAGLGKGQKLMKIGNKNMESGLRI